MLVKSVSPTRTFRLFPRSWTAVALALLVIQTALSVIVRNGSIPTAYSMITYFVVLVLAAGIATLNAAQNRQSIRLFWSFLAMAFGVWSLSACSWIYYVLVLGRDRPPSLIPGVPLVLHIVFMIAAVASRPHLKLSPHRGYRTTLDLLLLLFFWACAYAFLWVPHSYTDWNVAFVLRGQALYLVENSLLLVVLGILIIRAQPPWKSIYWHLLGASVLYILGSSIANYLLASRGYYVGLKDIPYMAAACWFVWVALQGQKLAPKLALSVQPDTRDTKYASILAMLSVVAIPVVGVWELFRVDEPSRTRVIRLLIILLSILFLAAFVFLKDYLANRELASDVGLAKEQYRRIVETTSEGVWLLDSNLHTSYVNRQMAKMLGYEPREMVGRSVFNFYFPDDVEHKKQILKRRQQGVREVIEERLRCKDGTELWVRMAATPVCKDNGEFDGAMAMVSDITARRRAEEAVRESEERFRIMADTAPVMVWRSGTDMLCDFFNKPWLEFTGRTIEQELGNGWSEGVHPQDFEHCLDTYVSSFKARQPFTIEYRLRRADGEYRWLLDKGVPRYAPKGEFAGYVGSCLDITERKLAEQEREELAGRLINAQERERSRLARELHDDFNQRLAVLAIDLERCSELMSHSPAEASQRMLELWNRASEIGADLHTLSHQLHSSTLESLGLVAGIRSFCTEFSEQQGIPVDFAHEDVPSSIPSDIALCLFRIVQEGLRNVKKHSGASRAQVRLKGDAKAIRLSLSDNGVGFNFATTSATVGLGIRSMQERLRMVGGVFEIRSRPTHGAQIAASVPLKPSVGRNSNRPAALPVEVDSLHPDQVKSLGDNGGRL